MNISVSDVLAEDAQMLNLPMNSMPPTSARQFSNETLVGLRLSE
jgi:hypothetical protein